MARKPRIEIEGGLYHIITRGNNRETIFHDEGDYRKMLSLFSVQKGKRPFYLYAYCLMLVRRTHQAERLLASSVVLRGVIKSEGHPIMRDYVLGARRRAARGRRLFIARRGSRLLLGRSRHAGCVSDIIRIIVRPASVLALRRWRSCAPRLITPLAPASLGGSRSRTPRFATPPKRWAGRSRIRLLRFARLS